MKAYLVLLIAFFSIVSYSQGKSIVMHKKNSERTTEIAEHKRIKITTADGNKYWGRFTVIDTAHIMIEGNLIALNSIVKIKRKSLAGTIVRPVVVVAGFAAVVPIGAAAILLASSVSEGFAIFYGGTVVICGPMISIPMISNNHPTKKIGNMQ